VAGRQIHCSDSIYVTSLLSDILTYNETILKEIIGDVLKLEHYFNFLKERRGLEELIMPSMVWYDFIELVIAKGLSHSGPSISVSFSMAAPAFSGTLITTYDNACYLE
jgi:hypothetical protein